MVSTSLLSLPNNKENQRICPTQDRINCKLRFEIDEQVFVIRGMLWHLADYKSLLYEMLEPINYRFPDRLLNDRPYDYSLF